MRQLAPLLPLLNSAFYVVSFKTATYFIETTLLMFLQQVWRRMVIAFYEAMIDSQLHKINYKTLLEYAFCVMG